MNVIADRLFALLLGWTKALFNGLWVLLGNRDSGAAGFIQRFWLPILLILVAFGIVTDYVIWLIRWRPYFVWRTWLRKLGSSRRERMTRGYMESLDHSPLELPGDSGADSWRDTLSDRDMPVFFDVDTTDSYTQEDAQAEYSPHDGVYDDPYAAGAMGNGQYGVETAGLDSPYVPALEAGVSPDWQTQPMGLDDAYDPTAAEPSWSSLLSQVRQRREAEVAAGLPFARGWTGGMGEQAQDAQPDLLQGIRKRRSGRVRRKTGTLRALGQVLFTRGSEEPVDSLPPPISQDTAFRQTYIPQNYRYNEGKKSE